MAYQFIEKAERKWVAIKNAIKTLIDFQSAVAEGKATGETFALKHEVDGVCYRALARNKAGAIRFGEWSYLKKDVADLDSMVAKYGKAEVFGWAFNEFLTDNDDQAINGESKGRTSKADALKAQAIKIALDTYDALEKVSPEMAETAALKIATENGVLKEVVEKLGLEIATIDSGN